MSPRPNPAADAAEALTRAGEGEPAVVLTVAGARAIRTALAEAQSYVRRKLKGAPNLHERTLANGVLHDVGEALRTLDAAPPTGPAPGPRPDT